MRRWPIRKILQKSWKRYTIQKDRSQSYGPKILSLRAYWKQAKQSHIILRLPDCRLFLFSEDKKGGQFFILSNYVFSKQTETLLKVQPTLINKGR